MSVSRFPNPLTTNFIPEAWDFPILDRYANFIVTYPIAQNANIVFQKVSVPTDIYTLIKMANTIYVNSVINSLLTAANIWEGLNTFGTINTNAITTNTITATTLALSGTQLDTPMTSTRTYPITPFSPTAATVNYGTAGTIGYTIVSSSNGALTITGTYPDINKVQVCRFTNTFISVPQGVWILQLEIQTNVIYGFTIGVSFGTTPIPAGDDRTVTTKKPGMFGCKYSSWNQAGVQNLSVQSGNSTLCHYTNTTGSNVIIYGFLYIGGYGLGIDRATMTAVKIA